VLNFYSVKTREMKVKYWHKSRVHRILYNVCLPCSTGITVSGNVKFYFLEKQQWCPHQFCPVHGKGWILFNQRIRRTVFIQYIGNRQFTSISGIFKIRQKFSKCYC